VVLFYTVENGYFDDLQKDKWSVFEKLFLELMRNRYFKLLDKIRSGKFDKTVKDKINEVVQDFKNEFLIS